MSDTKRLNLVLGAVAVTILLFSFSVYAYTLVPKGDTEVLVVNGTEYGWDTLFSDFAAEPFEANDDQYTGIPLETLLLDAGVESPQDHTYRFSGLDGYQKDVTWHDIQNGYLTEDGHRSVFPNLTQSFWVRNLASIEVI